MTHTIIESVSMRASPRKSCVRSGCAALAALTAAAPAVAHHPTGGQVPSSLLEGVLSGLAHPLLGADHAAFLVAVALLAFIALPAWRIAVGLIVGVAGGAWLASVGVDVPAVEAGVAASLVGVGVLLALGRRSAAAGVFGVAALVAGVWHGQALAESIVGADRNVVAAYLLGLVAMQVLVCGGVASVARQVRASISGVRLAGLLRMAGVAVGLFGAARLFVQ
jgi:urease accessory protein